MKVLNREQRKIKSCIDASKEYVLDDLKKIAIKALIISMGVRGLSTFSVGSLWFMNYLIKAAVIVGVLIYSKEITHCVMDIYSHSKKIKEYKETIRSLAD